MALPGFREKAMECLVEAVNNDMPTNVAEQPLMRLLARFAQALFTIIPPNTSMSHKHLIFYVFEIINYKQIKSVKNKRN